eukprot:TRINITY_DN5135_c0_g3_i2.p1 TRINITY_DN5135_c0_g3~~TRINITY_DN5135_c0_g3_i2.p1  ORF type:complete len:307 (-),score=75.48 TRINITY_DN5135_c0_g3_i2:589-1509(-)
MKFQVISPDDHMLQSPKARRKGLLGVSALIATLAGALSVSFVPPARDSASIASQMRTSAPSRSPLSLAAVSGSEENKPAQKEEYDPYDWQRVGGSGSTTAASKPAVSEAPSLSIDDLPDLPDFSDDGEGVEEVPSLAAKVKVREFNLPEIPGDQDLLPPEPNPIIDGGLGLFEWTGLWIGGLLLIAGIGAGASYILARAQLEPALADTLLTPVKSFFGLFQVLFLARVMLTQFPKIKTTEMPYALAHYPTEWILAPTRAVFKPEAGVDVAPILWLMLTLLAGELLTGPAGILQMAKNAPRMKSKYG